MPQCDPLNPDSWPDGYICVSKNGDWVLEKKAEGKKSPHSALIAGGVLGLFLGIMLSKR